MTDPSWDEPSGLYFDKDGKPISLRQWSELMANMEYKIIAKTKLPGGIEVSTVWLGIDHGFGMHGRPIIFETLVFPECEDMVRYRTLEDAIEGHEEMVAKYKSKKTADNSPRKT